MEDIVNQIDSYITSVGQMGTNDAEWRQVNKVCLS
jgi:hypothetical protein